MSTNLRWRKFSPIDRDFPVFELLAGDVIILDITKNASQGFEIAFHEGASGHVFDLGTIESMIADVKRLLDQEGEST